MLISSVTAWLLYLKLPKTHLRAVTPSLLGGGFCWPQGDPFSPQALCVRCGCDFTRCLKHDGDAGLDPEMFTL